MPSLVPEGVQGNGAGAVSVCPVKLGHPGREVLSATWRWSGILYSPLPRVTSWKDKYTLDPRRDIRCWQMVAPEQVAVFL